MRRLVLACLLVGALTLPAQPAADAYCLEWAMPNYDIPVYLINPGADLHGISVTNAIHDLRVAIDTWRENSAASFRPYYAGMISDTTLYPGTVQVRETSNCDTCEESYACEKTYNDVYLGRASIVYIEIPYNRTSPPDESCADNRYYSRQDDRVESLESLFTHELGHSWGLQDEYQNKCEGTAWMSAMAQNCPNGRYITRRDVAGLRSLYGTRQLTYKTRVSTDGALSWQAGPTDIGMIKALVRQSSLGTLVSSATREVLSRTFFGYTSSSYPYPYTRWETGSTGGIFSSGVPWVSASGYSWDYGGAASKSTSNYAIAYRPYEDENDCEKGVVISTWNGSTSINREAREVEPNTFYSFTDGASLAYDPAADVYVAAFTKDDYNLAFQLIDPATGNRIGFSSPGTYKSHYAPAIACNTVTYAGQYNCMVAWREPSGLEPIWYNRVKLSRTAPFVTWVAGQSELTAETFQSPSLTSYPSSSTPFILGVKEGDTYSTWRYASGSGTFGSKRTAIDLAGGTMVNGALGTQSGRVIIRYAEF